MARQAVTESEYELMKILWGADGPLTLGEILKALSGNKIVFVKTVQWFCRKPCCGAL